MNAMPKYPSTGHSVMRMCACCNKPRSQNGGAIRTVRGMPRQFVCAACKTDLDAKQEKK